MVTGPLALGNSTASHCLSSCSTLLFGNGSCCFYFILFLFCTGEVLILFYDSCCIA
ncbi:hypothetical protein BDV32DRAFT_126782 [Aspergillus pseudonomiae]|nr:hypothetical protein BDV32DRAFT_126782 [Aspergillus pseudonomiae]